MTEHMTPISFKHLLKWTMSEYKNCGSIFSIPKQLFFNASDYSELQSEVFGRTLSSPVGPAAGPHTQLAQNIISAWLTGSRFIELKTVQIMDELDIPRPCIDMTDEGYNVEWSQELRLKQSATEYIHAWIMIHILRRLLKMEDQPTGTVFNMSIGYDLKGIKSKPIQNFIKKMQDASEEIEGIKAFLRSDYPMFADIDIPTEISNNVTLSTMHGCPPSEIQKIGQYLLKTKKLHTTIKLNPTLLGKETLFDILHDKLGFNYIDIPQSVFDADTDWDTAVKLIKTLEKTATKASLHFGVKLSNTLAMKNVLQRLPGDEVYMSGRNLCPVTVNLFHKLQETFDYGLRVSYSAGADALNTAEIVGAGALPVTIASDLLKPGGYGRMQHVLERLKQKIIESGAKDLETYQSNAKQTLPELAEIVLTDIRYKKQYRKHGLPKLETALSEFDCITAPCTQTCPAEQSPPAYIRRIKSGNLDAALRSILKQNPLPGMTGYVCPHTCQNKCTRNIYDESVAIRDLKRYVFDNTSIPQESKNTDNPKVAIIGAGPAGLSAAAYLAEAGIKATIFEASDKAGGVPALAPEFRIPESVVQADIKRIENLGVEIILNHPVKESPETFLDKGYDAVFYAPGFKNDMMLDIPGSDGDGVLGVMDFLRLCRSDSASKTFNSVLVIGGGNTAMDAARTAQRLTSKPVKVVYRRTTNEMPAWEEEIDGFLEEGNEIVELTSPVKINRTKGKVTSVTCLRNELGDEDASGRRRPVPIKGSEYEISADLVIIAIGQTPDFNLEKENGICLGKKGEIIVNENTQETGLNGVYSGGDAVHGPSYIIQAAADGRKAAVAIARELGADETTVLNGIPQLEPDWDDIYFARTHLMHVETPTILPPEQRNGFDLINGTLTSHQAQKEVDRCMQCDIVCDRCVDVCPNRANMPVTIIPRSGTISKIVTDETGKPEFKGFEFFKMLQNRQIIHVDEFCNACGNCATFCTHNGEPYKDKPIFFLEKRAFESVDDDCWHINSVEMFRRKDGITYILSSENGGYSLKIGNLEMTITSGFSLDALRGEYKPGQELSLVPVAEMIILKEALMQHPLVLNI